jgi:hypothetical protein
MHIRGRDGVPGHTPSMALQGIQEDTGQRKGEDNRGNQLCLFCLLHDKARPCGAKQRPVNPACHVPNCTGKHIQKLHELLKDVFKEENQVHLVHGDDGWEESEEAWEVDGEGEMMIVGTIQREDNCSWQDASKSWLEQDEEKEGGTYHVGTCQGASSVPPEAREKQCSAVGCLSTEEYEDAETMEDSWWTPEPEDLQIKGGRERILPRTPHVLMREEALKKPTTVGSEAGQPVKKGATRRNKAASSGGKNEGNGKTPKGESGATAQPEKKEANARKEEGCVCGANQASRRR